jgi:hypothetical protein
LSSAVRLIFSFEKYMGICFLKLESYIPSYLFNFSEKSRQHLIWFLSQKILLYGYLAILSICDFPEIVIGSFEVVNEAKTKISKR